MLFRSVVGSAERRRARAASEQRRWSDHHQQVDTGPTAGFSMNARRFEIRENGWIEIEDQALETGPNEVETPSRVNGASHGAEGRFLSGTSRASVSSSLSDDECTTIRRGRARYRVAYPRPTPSARQFIDNELDIVSLVEPLGRHEHDSSSIVLDIVSRRSSRTTRWRSRKLQIGRAHV